VEYSIKEIVYNSRGERGMIVNISQDNPEFYQVLFDKDWLTGRADYIHRSNLRAANKTTKE